MYDLDKPVYTMEAPVCGINASARIRLQPVEWHDEASFAVEVRRVEAVPDTHTIPNEATVLNWSASFLTIAVLAALFGFGGSAGHLAGAAQLLCVVFFALFVSGVVIARRQILKTRQT